MARSLCPALMAAPLFLFLPAASLANAHAGPLKPLPAVHAAIQRHAVGLGKVVSTADGGQIFGWDIDQNGTDGLLASSQDASQPNSFKVSVETFDQKTTKITSSFAEFTGTRNTYSVDGIFAGDVGLVTHFVEPKGTLFAKRLYKTMNPVPSGKFTGMWFPGVQNESVLENAENQSTTTSVVYAIELKNQDLPDLVVGNLVKKKSTTIFHLDPFHYSLNNQPELAQDTVTNQAVIGSSPSSGALGGGPPVTGLVDLATGNLTEFTGFNNGRFGAGDVNGIAVDSNTGVECTTTNLNAQVEFYNLKTKSGIIAVQLPGTGSESELNSGAAVANDPVNKLFLVADPDYAFGGSAIVVYDEAGNFIEAITGFNFSNRFVVVPVRVAVNPALRMGWVDGPSVSQIQQFFY